MSYTILKQLNGGIGKTASEVIRDLNQELLRQKAVNDDLEAGWSRCSRACAKLEKDAARYRFKRYRSFVEKRPVLFTESEWNSCYDEQTDVAMETWVYHDAAMRDQK